MKTPNEVSQIPPEMLRNLRAVRAKDRRVRWSTGWLRGIAITLGVVLAAMILDWLVVFYDHRARWTLTLVALGCAAVGLIRFAIIPMFQRRSLADIARAVDHAHPDLEERYSTIAEVAQSPDAPEFRGSEAMIKKVAEQAAELSARVTPGVVVQRAGLVRALQYFGAVAAVLLVFVALDVQRAKILCARFWMPGSDISFTQVTARPGDVMIGKGEPLTLEFATSGRKADAAKLSVRSGDRDEAITLRHTATEPAKFVYARSSVNDPFEYRVRAGDGQTAWYHVTVAERPKITQVQLRVAAPAYSKLPLVEDKALPHRLRALEGSTLDVSFKADQPLTSMELKLSDGKVLPITEAADHTYHFNALLTNTFTFTPVFANQFHLDNNPKPSCEIVVYQDEAPTVKVVSPNEEITARPDDKVKIEFEARDDFGIADAKLLVTTRTETNTTTVAIPIPLAEDAGKKSVRKEVELDLAQFHLKQDQELSYVVQVTDTRENRASGKSDSKPPELAQNNAAKPSEAKPDDQKPADNEQKPADQNPNAKPNEPKPGEQKPSQVAQAKANTPPNNNPAAAKPDIIHQPDNPNLRPDQQNHIAFNNDPSKPNDREPVEGSKAPPNDMAKRVLDAGQCSSCTPMHILVDEWGRSFEGQQREKLEIAIDPILKQLDALLAKALEFTDGTIAAGKSPEGLNLKQSPAVDGAKGQLREADGAVTTLKNKTQGTAYAFIGLQLHDIREAHITPARHELSAVTLDAAKAKDDMKNLEGASFEIRQAREKLANLTKQYEAVKRDAKLADAMQRLKKMHQIFLEDTQAMLGSSKGTLNPQQRKVAEVDDEFADKLRKLLEEEKKIMAELAKILGDDPRLLRRYLALMELEGTSLRDQMTLLAQRQKGLSDDVARWAGAEEKERQTLAHQLLAAQAGDQAEVAALAAKMHENMVTWVPLDVPGDLEPIVACQKLAVEIANQSAEASEKTLSGTNGSGLAAANASLEKLRELQTRLPEIEGAWLKEPKLSAFTANRMTEVSELITRQSGWIKKIEALNTGDYPQAAEVEQYRLNVETKTLSDKLDTVALQVGPMSTEINAKAEELNGTVHKEIMPKQSDASTALSKKSAKDAMPPQAEAIAGFATGEKQFDELLKLIIAKLDEAPAPTSAGMGENKSLEEMLAMLEDEKKAGEGLGIPCRPINVSIQKDWMKKGSGSGSGSGSAAARAAAVQAKLAQQRADRIREEARKRTAEVADSRPSGPKSGPKKPRKGWNTLVSQLGDELRQGRDNVPPEQYRQAIEQYFNTISDRVPAAEPAPAPVDSTKR